MHSWSILLIYAKSYDHKEKRSITQSLDLLSGAGMKDLHVVRVREVSRRMQHVLGCVLKQKLTTSLTTPLALDLTLQLPAMFS